MTRDDDLTRKYTNLGYIIMSYFNDNKVKMLLLGQKVRFTLVFDIINETTYGYNMDFLPAHLAMVCDKERYKLLSPFLDDFLLSKWSDGKCLKLSLTPDEMIKKYGKERFDLCVRITIDLLFPDKRETNNKFRERYNELVNTI